MNIRFSKHGLRLIFVIVVLVSIMGYIVPHITATVDDDYETDHEPDGALWNNIIKYVPVVNTVWSNVVTLGGYVANSHWIIQSIYGGLVIIMIVIIIGAIDIGGAWI